MPRQGLVPNPDQNAPAPTPALQPQAQPQPANGGGLEPNVSPEEQQAYDAFVGNMGNLIYDDSVKDRLLKDLSTGDPIDALARAAAAMVMRTEDSASEATGEQVDPEILMNAGLEAVELLAEFAENSGVNTYDEDQMESAYLLAVDKYRQSRQNQGKLKPEAFQSDLDQLVQADKAGTIGKQFPAIEKYSQHIKNRSQKGNFPEDVGAIIGGAND